MLKDSSRDYEMTITNIGKGTTGDISIVMPNWMECVTGTDVAPLEYGESTTVILRLKPTENMQLNVPVNGNIAINCKNAQSVSIPFSITPVSTAQGTLVVDVADEYTYSTAEAPHVKGASVILRNPATNALVAEATTNENGLFTTTLPEGYYRLFVTSDNHDSYDGIIEVSPERETRKTINLSVQAIEVGWKVEDTTTSDNYELVTTVDFQTNVPVPVVELSVPNKLDVENLAVGESLIFYALLTNHGLIAAKDAALLLPEGFKHITFEPLAEYTGLTIAPNVTVTIPVKVTRVSRPAQAKARDIRRSTKPIDDDPCVGQPGTLYFWDCGLDRKWHRYKIAMQIGSCNSNDPSTWDPTPNPTATDKEWTGGWPEGTRVTSSPTLPTFGGYTTTSNQNKVTKTEDKGCEPCQNKFINKLTQCGISLIPVYGCVAGSAGCGVEAWQGNTGWRHNAGCILTGLGCAADGCSVATAVTATPVAAVCTGIGWTIDIINCLISLTEPCDAEAAVKNKSLIKRKTASSSDPAYLADFKANAQLPLAEMRAFHNMAVEFFGNPSWVDETSIEEQVNLITELLLLDETEEVSAESLMNVKPSAITIEQLQLFVERLNNTTSFGHTGDVSITNRIDSEKMAGYASTILETEAQARDMGYTSVEDMWLSQAKDVYKQLQESSQSVCSSITLEFKQSVVMTRQAFKGTLTVFNGHETDAMQNVKLNLVVTSEDGDVATEHEFDIRMNTLDGFGYTDQPSLTQGWTLDANATGTATVLFTPSKYAAPTEPKRYSFGGTLTYIDPFNGLEVSRTLTPVTLTVNPTADLVFTYFMQRDVLGDDPLTLDVVERKVPAEFSLLINNIGYGDAMDVRMVTQQPEITVNEKGLDIDFHLTSSQLNGGQESPVIGSSTATKFGDIPAQSTVYAQWWFESSLLGHFTKYNLDIKPISYSNPDMSLINLDQSSIKELIRSIKIDDNGEMLTGFLVNDTPDANDTPDMLYLTNGETADVAVAANVAVSKLSATDYELTVTPSATGWNYGVITDPTQGYSELKSVVRKSDGQEISLRNFWQTDRTLIDGKDWLYDNNLHFADAFGNGTETYVLTFEPTPDVVLEVAEFGGIPDEGDIATEDVQSVSVTFSKTIDPATFTADDITMNVQAERQDASLIGITTEDNKTFALDLTAINATSPNGYYTLEVQTADITDTEGFHGKNGKPAAWILYRGGLVQLLTSAYPEVAGNVQRVTEAQVKGWHAPASATEASAAYGSTVTLSATPNYGYEFSGWTLNGKPVGSSEPTLTTQAVGDMDVVANFRKKGYSVTIDTESDGGTVAGAGTGIYEYETQLTLTAAPDDDYILEGWTVDGQNVEGGATLTLTVTKATDVHARFVKAFTPGDVNGDGEIDIADVMAMHAHILQLSPQNFNVRAADLNADGLVEIDDVMNLHSIILKKQLIKSHHSLYRSARKGK